MRTIYDAKADALYVRFAETPIVESEEVSDGIVLDFDADGRIVVPSRCSGTANLALRAA